MLSKAYIRKYMLIARLIGEEKNECHSRKIGAVIIREHPDGTSKIVGTGNNGPAPKTPHPTSEVYLREYFWPQLTDNDKDSLKAECLTLDQLRNNATDRELLDAFVSKYTNREVCPRRLVGAKSGERPQLCSCGHAERHAVTNAGEDLHGCTMICWCGVPCLQCTDTIIQAGIKTVHCLVAPDYDKMSRWLFQQAGVTLIEHDRTKFRL